MRALFERKRVKVKIKQSVKVFVEDRSFQGGSWVCGGTGRLRDHKKMIRFVFHCSLITLSTRNWLSQKLTNCGVIIYDVYYALYYVAKFYCYS